MAIGVQINPNLLAWARETAGLSPEAAATKLGLKTTAKATASEKLLEAERGERQVGRGLLQKAAAAYQRPLVTFYLPNPPSRGERGQDFRVASGARSPRNDAMLDALVRDVRARQQLVREVLADDEDFRSLPFVGTSRVGDGAIKVAAGIRSELGVTVEDQRRAKNPAAMFSLLRSAAEKTGVFVLLLGDLGSHHSDLGDDIFRGFALADKIAPFVVINDNDAVTARSFSLIHELAHIWIGASGVSGPLQGLPESVVERFCNEVAGEFLLPSEGLSVVSEGEGLDAAHALELSNEVSNTWKVSQGVVVYRLMANGWITDEVSAALFRLFAERWRVERQRAKDSRETDDSGPSFYIVRRSRLGAGLLSVVRRALQDDVLTHTKAARILGVAATRVDQLLQERRRAA